MGCKTVNEYRDETRGIYQREECAKQLISFEGLVFRGRNGVYNVTPTDIDGCVQLDAENCFIFFELKHSGGMSSGQESALAKLCDAILDSGREAVVFMAVHNVPLPEVVLAKDAKVTKIYYGDEKFPRKWHNHKHEQKTLKEAMDGFVDYIKKKNHREDNKGEVETQCQEDTKREG